MAQNIDATAAVAELAHAAGVSCEGEIGFVGYAGGAGSAGTDPEEAARFARETGVDAMAISIGNLHLQQSPGSGLDLARLRAIEALTDGAAGHPRRLGRAAGAARRTGRHQPYLPSSTSAPNCAWPLARPCVHAVNRDPARFDRIAILKETHAPVFDAARQVFRNLGASGRAYGRAPGYRPDQQGLTPG